MSSFLSFGYCILGVLFPYGNTKPYENMLSHLMHVADQLFFIIGFRSWFTGCVTWRIAVYGI